MKKLIILLLCLTLLASVFAGCTSLKGDEKGAVISVYLASYPQTLDPALVQLNSDVTQVLGLIFQSLTTIDSKGRVVGALAESWYSYYDKIDDEYKMYFKLKSTSWNDKRPVSADDVVYAWTRILDPGTESPYAAMLYPIKNAKEVKSGVMTVFDLGLAAVNSDLLEITFEEDYDIELFAEIVSSIHLCPIREDVVSRALGEKNPKDQDWAASAASIISNGPYAIRGMEEGVKLVLERNAYFMREEDDYLDKYVLPYRIVCLYQEDEVGTSGALDTIRSQIEFQTKRFEDGDIFYLSGFDKDTFAQYSKDMVTKNTLNSYVYYYNTESEALTDARVRQALSVALDRNKIVSEITGTGEIAATGYIPKGVYYSSNKEDFRAKAGDLNSTSADVEKAKQLLTQAGVKKGESFTLTYLIPESKELIKAYSKRVNYTNVYEDIAKYAKGVWEGLGFKVELVGLNPVEYTEALYNRTYDVLGINNIMNSTDAFTYLAPFSKYYSGCKISINFEEDAYTLHYTNLDSKEYEGVIDSIVFVSNRTERAELLRNAEIKFTELSPATALFYYTNSYVTAKGLSKVEDSFFGYRILDGLKLKNYRDINSREDAASTAAGK
ncbi:MAG: hypothetical protein CVU97_04700 [Firmicutes bacterium HGW-Firmicutes-21]|nr:MAG: hypothetical protein CVU97_04700 [Firmicutes bacterium HGW-Firmicutes-21]